MSERIATHHAAIANHPLNCSESCGSSEGALLGGPSGFRALLVLPFNVLAGDSKGA